MINEFGQITDGLARSLMTGVLIDIRTAIKQGDTNSAINLVRNWRRRGGWTSVLTTTEIEVLQAAGWEGDPA